jgi:hypothetical protein
MANLRVKEEFLNATRFRDELRDLQKHLEWDDRSEPLPVRIVMNQSGQPLAAVMPYRGYELLRELIFVLKERARTGPEEEKAPFIDTETADDAIKALRQKAAKNRVVPVPAPVRQGK